MPQRKKVSLAARRKRMRFFILCLGGVFAVSLVVLLAFGARMAEVTIADVAVSGVHYVDADTARAVVEGQLKGSYFFLIPRANTFFYPRRGIEKELKKVFVPVEGVTVARSGLTALSVSITERVPVAVWCTGSASTSSCFLMDENGLVFAPSDEGVSSNAVTYHSASVSLGDTFLSGDFKALSEFVYALGAATHRAPKHVLVDEHDDVYVQFVEGGEVRFVRTADKKALLENIASVFASKRLNSDDSLEYVDFRFGNKVYVKFVGE